MFKNKGKFAAALSEVREFEGKKGLVMRFDPEYNPPFVCKAPNSNDWKTMIECWEEYASVKEIFPDLVAIRACVINHLSGKRNISDTTVKEILAMGRHKFTVEGAHWKPTLGFSPKDQFGMKIANFFIEKHGDMYLAVGDKSK